MSNKQYTSITIEGEQWIVPVNPYMDDNGLLWSYNSCQFNKSNPPILWKGTPLAEGAVLDEGEIEIRDEVRGIDTIGIETRQVATLKVKPTTGIHRPVGIVDFGKPKANQKGEQLKAKDDIIIIEFLGVPSIKGAICSYDTKEIRSEIQDRFKTEKTFVLPDKYTYTITSGGFAKISTKQEGEQGMEEECQYPISVQYAIGLLHFIRHEVEGIPDDVYERISNVIYRLECEFDEASTPKEQPVEQEFDLVKLKHEAERFLKAISPNDELGFRNDLKKDMRMYRFVVDSMARFAKQQGYSLIKS